jgi:hypothetical protein
MDGKAVFKLTVALPPRVADELLTEANIKMSDMV